MRESEIALHKQERERERERMLGAGVSSLSREISARLVEAERQPERDKEDEERAYANREDERCNEKSKLQGKR